MPFGDEIQGAEEGGTKTARHGPGSWVKECTEGEDLEKFGGQMGSE